MPAHFAECGGAIQAEWQTRRVKLLNRYNEEMRDMREAEIWGAVHTGENR
jgi:hypothetical protein